MSTPINNCTIVTHRVYCTNTTCFQNGFYATINSKFVYNELHTSKGTEKDCYNEFIEKAIKQIR